MIDADTVDQALGIEAEVKRVRGVEHDRVFGAEAGEVVDREEAPPVEFVIGNAPGRETIMLAVDQRGYVVGCCGGLILVTDRQAVFAIRFEDIATVDLLDPQRATRERLGERIAQDRKDEHLTPVDVEVAREFAGFTVC